MHSPVAKRTPGVVLLTGASAGLGLSLARLLCDSDYRVILTARQSSMKRFDEMGIHESNRVWLRPLDVTLQNEREAVMKEAAQEWGGVDVLINNAGVAYRAVIEHFTEAGREEQMDVNFRGPMELIQLALPGMRQKRYGRIINISSVSGLMAMPTMGLYSASKFALEGATEALWYEVRPWNIKVTLVQPGFIHSESFRNTVYTEQSRIASENPLDPYYQQYHHMAEFIEKLMHRSFSTPEKVAQRIIHTIREPNPPLRLPATFDAFIFALLRRVLPRNIYHWMLFCGLPGVKCWGGEAPGVMHRSSSKVR